MAFNRTFLLYTDQRLRRCCIAILCVFAERRHILVLLGTLRTIVYPTTFPTRMIVEISQKRIVTTTVTSKHFRSARLSASSHRIFGSESGCSAVRTEVAPVNVVFVVMEQNGMSLRLGTGQWLFEVVDGIAGEGIGFKRVLKEICAFWMDGKDVRGGWVE